MTRRRQILIAGGILLAAPLRVFAQKPGKVRRISFLIQGRREASPVEDRLRGAFLKSVGALGYTEGRNLEIEWHFDDRKTAKALGLAISPALLARADRVIE